MRHIGLANEQHSESAHKQAGFTISRVKGKKTPEQFAVHLDLIYTILALSTYTAENNATERKQVPVVACSERGKDRFMNRQKAWR